MKEDLRDTLEFARDICDEEDKSMEYTIQFMLDFARVSFPKVSFEDVMTFLENKST